MPDLFWIRMSSNKLTELDLSNNRKLLYLDLSSNYLKRLNLQNLDCLQNAEFNMNDEAKIEDLILDGVNSKCRMYYNCS